MSKRVFATLLLLTTLSALTANQSRADDDKPTVKPLSASVAVNAARSQSQFTPCLTQLNKFGLQCARQSTTPGVAVVADVANMSPAYHSGLQYGDGIMSVETHKDNFQLTVNRQGKLYSVTLNASDLTRPPLYANTQKLAATIDSSGPRFAPSNGVLENNSLTGRLDRTLLKGAASNHPFTQLEIATIRHEGVVQGATGNCWFEAGLSAVADSPDGPAKIATMITTSEYGYEVKFPGVGMKVEVNDDQIAASGVADPAKWAQVLEVAETKVYPDNAPSRQALTDNPGVKVGLSMLTGEPIEIVRPETISTTELSDLLTKLRSQGKPITAASMSPAEHKQSIQPVMPNHAYSVVNFDSGRGLITLRNPLGREFSGRPGLVERISQDEIQMDLTTFSTFFRWVAYPQPR